MLPLPPVGPRAQVAARPTDKNKLDAPIRDFEAMLVRQMLAEVRPSAGLVKGAAAGYADFMDQALADAIAAGDGLGLSRQVTSHIAGGEQTAQSRPQTTHLSEYPKVRHLSHQTSGFGERHDPFDGTIKGHSGVDLGARAGTPIHATADGVVAVARNEGGYGNLVIIDHGDGKSTRYAHCADLLVKPGDRVSAGDEIATVGATGRATGPHLHFELREHGHAVDPSAWILEHVDPLKDSLK
jgi:murein DD-endopeptidase MepM/ murein hydrolase activator NlpD